MNRVSDLDKMAKLLDGELEVFCGKVFPMLTLPFVRFVKEFCTGMAVAKSTVISRIARAIRPTAAETKTFLNMTSRYLEKRGVDRKLNRAVAHDVGKTVKRNTLLLMDPTDIVKPFSSGKQEYIAKVRDGSTGKLNADGYSGCMVAACECGGSDRARCGLSCGQVRHPILSVKMTA